jgi:DNA polymerase-3 subunit epsilon
VNFDGPVAFVDVETTGGHPGYHRIVEIAVVQAEGGVAGDTWSTLVNPGVRLPPTIQRLTGIDPSMLEDAPPFAAVADEVARRLDGRLFVAHNVRFDYGFVRNEMRRAGHEFAARTACTVRLSRALYPELPRHNLDAIIAHHELPCAARHRALPDAMALWQLWQRMRADFPAQQLDATLEAVMRRPALPPQVDADLVDELPDTCGVYRFLGEGDALLYVGKAQNLRERVIGHFQGAVRDTKSRRLAAQVRRIAWQETAGELGALLLEARMVREERPVYNRRLRGGGEALTWVFDDAGAAPTLAALDDGFPQGDAFGLFRTAREARNALTKVAREAELCLKVLGLETGEGSCFAHQLGRCRGVCAGLEPPARHLARVKLSLARERLKPWPWRGPVVLPERSATGLEQWHVLDAWQYLGTLQEECEDLPRRAGGFDVDTYRILARHLAAPPRGVRPIGPRPHAATDAVPE